jgi:hypothetical protein
LTRFSRQQQCCSQVSKHFGIDTDLAGRDELAKLCPELDPSDDSATALHMRNCHNDAMSEFDGQTVSLSDD